MADADDNLLGNTEMEKTARERADHLLRILDLRAEQNPEGVVDIIALAQVLATLAVADAITGAAIVLDRIDDKLQTADFNISGELRAVRENLGTVAGRLAR